MAVRTMLTRDDILQNFDKTNYNFGTDVGTKHFYIKAKMELANPYSPLRFDCDVEFDFTPNQTGVYPFICLLDGDQSGYYENGVLTYLPQGVNGGTYTNIRGTLNDAPIDESFFNGETMRLTGNDYAFGNFDWDFTVGGQPLDTNLPVIIQGTGGRFIPQSWFSVDSFLQLFDEFYSPSASYWKAYSHSNLLWESNPVLERLINLGAGGGQEIPEGNDYYIYNKYRSADIDAYGNKSNYGPILGKFERIKMEEGGHCSLYHNKDDNSLTIKYSGTIYSSSYKTEAGAVYHDELGTIQEIGPFYYRIGNQIGRGVTFATFLQTNMRVWDDEQAAEDDAGGNPPEDKEPEEGNLSDVTPPDGPEDETEFGSSDARSPFGKVYSMALSQLLNVTNIFYTNDESILSNIKKGLELYGANPIQSIISLMYFPFNENQVGTWTSENSISFGSYSHELPFTIKKLAAPGGYLDAGSFELARRWNDWRDYAPYQSVTIYLPYVGLKQLDLARYLGKRVNIRYYVDIYTGTGICCLMSNGQMIEYHDCMLGVSLPIQGSDFASYASSMMQAVMSSGNSIIGGAQKGAQMGGQFGSPVVGALGGMVGGVASSAGAIFSLDHMSKPNDLLTTKGSFSGGVALNMPQYIYLIYEYYETETPRNLHTMCGLPSNYGGRGSEFSGFTKASSVELNTEGMTVSEVNELESLLQSGVYL